MKIWQYLLVNSNIMLVTLLSLHATDHKGHSASLGLAAVIISMVKLFLIDHIFNELQNFLTFASSLDILSVGKHCNTVTSIRCWECPSQGKVRKDMSKWWELNRFKESYVWLITLLTKLFSHVLILSIYQHGVETLLYHYYAQYSFHQVKTKNHVPRQQSEDGIIIIIKMYTSAGWNVWARY